MRLTKPLAVEESAGNNTVRLTWNDYRPSDTAPHIKYEGRLVTQPATLLGQPVLDLIADACAVRVTHRATVYGKGSGSSYEVITTIDPQGLDEVHLRGRGAVAVNTVIDAMLDTTLGDRTDSTESAPASQ